MLQNRKQKKGFKNSHIHTQVVDPRKTVDSKFVKIIVMYHLIKIQCPDGNGIFYWEQVWAGFDVNVISTPKFGYLGD